jgi:hypothetical protein
MGNLVGTIKRFLGNKNTVTILAVLAGVILLWYFYNYRVNQAITTIRIPYAIDAIDAGKKIESDNLDYKEITSSTTRNSDIITNMGELEDMYVCTGTSIPKDGFFYKSQICKKEQIKNSIYEGMADEGYTTYNLEVDNRTTFANTIMPGDYIDLYVEATDDAGKSLFGPLIESIEVRGVYDSSGRDVYWDSDAGDAAYLIFVVPNEYHKLLNVARMNNIDITPVPRSASYSLNPKETQIGSQELKNYITSKAAAISN